MHRRTADAGSEKKIVQGGAVERSAIHKSDQGLAERCGQNVAIPCTNELTALPAPGTEQLSLNEQPVPDPEQRCDRCGTPFSPRRGSGGSRQRFCPLDKPSQDETVPRDPAVAALHPWETGVLDIASCERVEFVVALQEGETARHTP
ncbi:MAG: hypothetical protein ACLP19_04940 [Xanthobacteraceae bacterium]